VLVTGGAMLPAAAMNVLLAIVAALGLGLWRAAT
jgi:hypothetical protein